MIVIFNKQILIDVFQQMNQIGKTTTIDISSNESRMALATEIIETYNKMVIQDPDGKEFEKILKEDGVSAENIDKAKQIIDFFSGAHQETENKIKQKLKSLGFI